MLHLHFQRLAHSLITVSLDYFYRWGEYGCTREWLAQSPVVPVNHRQQQLLSFFFPCGSQKCLWSQLFPWLVKCQVAISNIVLRPVPSSWAGWRGMASCMQGHLKPRREDIKKKGRQKQRNAKKNGPVLLFNRAKQKWEKLSEWSTSRHVFCKENKPKKTVNTSSMGMSCSSLWGKWWLPSLSRPPGECQHWNARPISPRRLHIPAGTDPPCIALKGGCVSTWNSKSQ